MYDYISGTLVNRQPTHAIIECNGIGYHLNISLNTFSRLKEGSACKLFTHLSVKEDAHLLYGFIDEFERRIFRLLISVSGIGESTARMMLSSLSPADIEEAVITSDVNRLQSIKGIGNKSAQRLVIELKDKMKKSGAETLREHTAPSIRSEAVSALLTLGFMKSAAEKSIDTVIKSRGNDLKVEELIKAALGSMS